MKRFTNHIYALTAGKADLTAVDDVKNLKGATVVKRGGIITPELYTDLRNQGVIHPLPELVCYTKLITAESLSRKINEMVAEGRSLLDIKSLSDWSKLELCCFEAMEYPFVGELLTAFSLEAPELFNQSLLSAYLAYLCQLLAEKSIEEIEHAFMAGLLHDIGLLFISRKLRNKSGRLTGNEWRQLQSHPIVAAKMLKRVPGFPEGVRVAILEHHEKTNGSGYPLGKPIKKISELGLLLSLLDDVVAIYRKKFKPLKRTLNDMYPIIQMNTQDYPPELLSSILQILKKVQASDDKDIDLDTLRDLIEYTYQQQLYINKLMDIAAQVDRSIDPNHKIRAVRHLQSEYKKLDVIITTSGLQESCYIEWLQKLGTNQWLEIYNEIEHTRLMLEEVVYMLNSFYNSIGAFLARSRSNEITKSYELFVHVYSMTSSPAIPSSLEHYWHR